jgi:hypothetical protein
MLWQSCAVIPHGGVSAGLIWAFSRGFPKNKYSGWRSERSEGVKK